LPKQVFEVRIEIFNFLGFKILFFQRCFTDVHRNSSGTQQMSSENDALEAKHEVNQQIKFAGILVLRSRLASGDVWEIRG
jgi:hypothetical protein